MGGWFIRASLRTSPANTFFSPPFIRPDLTSAVHFQPTASVPCSFSSSHPRFNVYSSYKMPFSSRRFKITFNDCKRRSPALFFLIRRSPGSIARFTFSSHAHAREICMRVVDIYRNSYTHALIVPRNVRTSHLNMSNVSRALKFTYIKSTETETERERERECSTDPH